MGETSFLLTLGTTNIAKGKELVQLLGPYGFEIRTLADYDNAIDVVEDGDSFAENARKKATEQAQHLGCWVLADDSGLEVKSLDGRPGIYSARFAGPEATDLENNAQLLKELADLSAAKRAARYFCHVAVADPSGEVRAESFDHCCGRIRTEPSGSNGFGYDPLFEVLEFHRTFGQLGPHLKSLLSHRGRAIRAIVPQLVALKNKH
ncbi:non-canonical purine NTP pyrophosphatase [Adhaeretor mobilis]|uniref:dITP/XTP pyrophosphatase n=1 Tax=Adhaeretor mobilis TaxID=1930276 RepID=A0A517MSW3_9BACT|nr:non-canonical purine NTP pyrophosphatase [Adhaeretor mobilis]QDS97887.1 Non-canonical purine NTP pyrophosphatase [Adhaeretor mobilis]